MLKKIWWFFLLLIVIIISPFMLFFGDIKNSKLIAKIKNKVRKK